MDQVHDNPSYISDETNKDNGLKSQNIVDTSTESSSEANITDENSTPGRENWGKGIEFLLSCIAMSVGLGNVWRFPFIGDLHFNLF